MHACGSCSLIPMLLTCEDCQKMVLASANPRSNHGHLTNAVFGASYPVEFILCRDCQVVICDQCLGRTGSSRCQRCSTVETKPYEPRVADAESIRIVERVLERYPGDDPWQRFVAPTLQ